MLLLELEVPTVIFLHRVKSKDKRVSLNLNTYRNLHYIISNNAKKAFKDAIQEHFTGIRVNTSVRLEYVIYSNSKRKFDIMNIGSIVDKFFCDALVETGVLKDDNYNYVQEVSIKYGGEIKGKEIKCFVKIHTI